MQTETLFEIRHANSGAMIGIGNEPEIAQLCDDGILPPREELMLTLVGTYRLAA